DEARVRPRPRVVVVSTGSELVEPGHPLAPGQITDSNSFTLAAAAQEAGAVSYRIAPIGDDPNTILGLLEDQLVRADLIITTGGVSAGAYDVVKSGLSQLGAVGSGTVGMEPGQRRGWGTLGECQTQSGR